MTPAKKSQEIFLKNLQEFFYMIKRSKLILVTAVIAISQVSFWSQRMNSPKPNKEASFSEIAATLGAAAAASTLAIKNPKLLLAPAAAMGSMAFANTPENTPTVEFRREQASTGTETADQTAMTHSISERQKRKRNDRTYRGRLGSTSSTSTDTADTQKDKKDSGTDKNPALTPVHIIKMDNKDCYIVGRNNKKNGDLEVLFISTVNPRSKEKHFLRVRGPRPNYRGLMLSDGFFSDLFPELKNRQKTLILFDTRFNSDEASSIFASFKQLSPLKG